MHKSAVKTHGPPPIGRLVVKRIGHAAAAAAEGDGEEDDERRNELDAERFLAKPSGAGRGGSAAPGLRERGGGFSQRGAPNCADVGRKQAALSQSF